VTATLLAAAVVTPIIGRLGDMYGKRRMLLVSIGLLVMGSSVAGLSTTLAPLIVGRVLQGLAVGVIPLSISIMRDELPAEKIGSATAMMSASLGVGGAIGLPVAAFLAQSTDWHVLFWTSAALGVVAFALVLAAADQPGLEHGRLLDVRDVPGATAASPAADEHRLRARSVDACGGPRDGADRPVDDGDGSRLSPDHSRLRRQGHPDARRGRRGHLLWLGHCSHG
jgi:MFS family permease